MHEPPPPKKIHSPAGIFRAVKLFSPVPLYTPDIMRLSIPTELHGAE